MFVLANGLHGTSKPFKQGAGVFGIIASVLGYYCAAYYLLKDSWGLYIPLGDTSALRRWVGKD